MRDIARPALAEMSARPSLDFHCGPLHYHSCPECYDRAPCRMACAIEPDLSSERPTGAHATCDDCASATERCARVVYESGGAEEAQDRLCRADLYPWTPGDETAPRWWCDDHDPRDEDHDTPPSLPALVAVASLGAASLVTSVALAGELAPGAVVVWRVMTRATIVRHHELMVRDGDGTSHAYVFSHEQERHRRPQAFGGQPAWPDVSPWMSLPHVADRWSALRALAVGEGPTPQPTGVHLVALDASRIVLAVEAIGGDRG